MNRKVNSEMEDELLPEYDFSQLEGGVRGKYVERYQKSTNLVLLEPDVAQMFPDAHAVNEALRLLLRVMNSNQALVTQSPGNIELEATGEK
ncbi:hypothetical protein [Calothrix sp. PCC 6303]|uniref:hypothetical protein n=1 Tax=Calothrix sp. PCC 6303 TaxID=1170562 RepID=UPI0002A00B27|nr:hypothetical protein [Calothrix sp. PCC 6303]AFY99532.1 hypothetical protein Cal6303_0455 [Calothrix sp. PCC 6303]